MPSKKLRSVVADEGEELSVDMSPMIDMVFLLLIFFIVASTAVIVKQDPEVQPPVAVNSKPQKDGKGRIVINIREDGTLLAEDTTIHFDKPEDIEDYVKKAKETMKGQGIEPIVHLRADKRVSFQYVRKVIKSAARAGVDKVVFSVMGFEK